MQRSTIRRKTRWRRTAAWQPPWRPLSDEDHHAYQEVTERARTEEGYLRCDGCGRSLLDGQEHRHHRIPRSLGGRTTVDNLMLLCPVCHERAHGYRVRIAEDGANEDDTPS